jgi:hypothetical protein
MNSHFYFKFGEGNSLLNKEVSEGAALNLSIYFNKDESGWKIGGYLKDGIFEKPRFEKDAGEHKISVSDVSQATIFIQTSLPEHRAHRFLWIFKHPKIYVFQPTGLVFDGEADEKKVQRQLPKEMPCVCKRIFEAEKLPEFFAALNANQGFNRRTIRQFEAGSAICEIAEHLLFPKAEKLKTVASRRFEFLSPVQFETFVFLIFHHSGAHCSTFRGGSRPEIDLTVRFFKTSAIGNFEPGRSIFFQIKMKEKGVAPPDKNRPNEYLIWLGASDFQSRVLGKTWLENQLLELPEVEKWLNLSLDFLTF